MRNIAVVVKIIRNFAVANTDIKRSGMFGFIV